MLFLLANGTAYSTPGVKLQTPTGYVVSNLDPNLNSTLNNQIYDANFIPGFDAGLQNTSVYWSSGLGYGKIGYSIGPWAHDTNGYPHLAVGPQCCNFKEVPHTQQFRLASWGDYYDVTAGFGLPGVNIQNYTSDFTSPAYVGLRTDWNWTVQLSLDWSPPASLDRSNEWAAVGVTATQYVPSAPGKLVYSVVDVWMNQNGSGSVAPSIDGESRLVVRPNVVIYHPLQLTGEGNQTVTIQLSHYLEDTLSQLGLGTSQSQPPVISYVYLSVEGYNFRWNGTLWSFKVMTPASSPRTASTLPLELVAVPALLASALILYKLRKRLRAVW